MSKSSTKVLAPPGGRTSINIFSSEVQETCRPVNKCQAERTRSQIFAGVEDENSKPPAQNGDDLSKTLATTKLEEKDENANYAQPPEFISNGHGEEENTDSEEETSEDNMEENESITDNCKEPENPEAESPETRPVNECQVQRNKSTIFATDDEESEPISRKKTSPVVVQPEMDHRPKTATRVLSPPGGATSISIFGDNYGSSSDQTPPTSYRSSRGGQSDHRSTSFNNVFGGNDTSAVSPRRRTPSGGASHNIFG